MLSYSSSKPHVLIVLSLLPETIYLLSGLIATEVTKLLWPVKVFISFPFSKCQIFIVLSPLPDTIYLLS